MMKYLSLLFCVGALIHCQAQTGAGTRGKVQSPSGLVAEGATPRLISNQFSFTEGPAADEQGNVYFTDQPDNKIWKYGTDGKLSIFLANAGRSNGMYFDKKGNLIACADEHNQLWSIKPAGQITVLVKDVKGLHLNGPNDVWVSPGGNIYFTDPYYQRDYWTRTSGEIAGQKVYLLQQNALPLAVADDLEKPNGLVGTRDGKLLYVSDIKAGKIYKYNIEGNGSLGNRTFFVEHRCDGMTIDQKGNLYLAGEGVTVYNPEGKKIEYIEIPEPWTANVTFGGSKKNILFITASKAIYALTMKVKGAQ